MRRFRTGAAARSCCRAAALVGLLAAAPAFAAEPEEALQQAAQHFADLEDGQAKAILEELSADGVTDADVLLGYLYADPLYAGRDYQTAVQYFEDATTGRSVVSVYTLPKSSFWPSQRSTHQHHAESSGSTTVH